jgi:DNA invertase Pin-like site-specific DNA recombinase
VNDKILKTHLGRRATVYLRQSTMKQVLEHRESTARQYALRERAIALGWAAKQIDVVDGDLGKSGTTADGRDGFERLAEDVAHGRVGAILALEVSRLARSSADWHRLLDLCGLADVVIIDEQAIYTARDYNDRLLLGLKGTMSEAELYWMRLRLHGGQISKARRGEYRFVSPAGYEWDAATSRFRLDPDENVQRAVRLVFERFRLEGSAYRVARYFERHGLQMPVRDVTESEVKWGPIRQTLIASMLHNPIYAGAYAYGRHERRLGLVEGKKRPRWRRLPQDEWKVCLRDHHPAYISWEEFMANKEKLQQNRTNLNAQQRGAARDGCALLQGLVLCGHCARRMHVHYTGDARRPIYQCRLPVGAKVCSVVPAKAVDESVARLFLDAVKPPEIELGLAIVHEAERQASDVDRQWNLRLERAQYEARLAERRYKAIDPDNRVVARTLEREWNEKLEAIEQIEREREEVRQREKVEITNDDRARILALAKNLSIVWGAPTTTNAERKNLLRMLVREVTVTRIDVPRMMTRVQVLWQTGAVSDFTIERRDKFSATATPTKATAFIEEHVNEKTDEWIATALNRRGLRTGRGKSWSRESVRRVRYAHGWFPADSAPETTRATDQDASGLYSARALAMRVNVKTSTILLWVRRGIIEPALRGSPGRAYRFKLDGRILTQIEEEKQKMKERRAAACRESRLGLQEPTTVLSKRAST